MIFMRKYTQASKDWHKKYYGTHKEQRKKYMKNYNEVRKYHNTWYFKLKVEVLTYYSNGTPRCVCCGESIIYFLTIDHVNNNGAEHRKEINCSGTLYSWLKRNNYPEGYQVLCFNCNCGKQINHGICPHKGIKYHD